jgi:hypothetical protein
MTEHEMPNSDIDHMHKEEESTSKWEAFDMTKNYDPEKTTEDAFSTFVQSWFVELNH